MPAVRKESYAEQLRQQGIALLRKTRLLPLAEWTRLRVMTLKHGTDNTAFLKEHPGFVPPPAALMHDAYSTVSYRTYMKAGEIEARMLADLIRTYAPGARRILEWGCGPARLLRHMQGLLPGVQFYGADYNAATIGWCREAIPGITFAAHSLAPPLPFTEKFDVIYAVSVLTHLSIEQQDAWMGELARALAPGGILIITTHGERCAHVLLSEERVQFEQAGVVIRSGVKEGARCFTSYHHPRYAREHLFAALDIRAHIPENPCPHTEQDIWVLQRRTH